MKIKSIVSSVMNVISAGSVTFTNLPLSCQARVLYSRALAANSSIQFWTARLNDENATDSLRKRACMELEGENILTPQGQRHLPGLNAILASILPRVKALTNYNSDTASEVQFDASFAGDESIAYEFTATTGKPFLWLQSGLESKGISLEGVEASADGDLLLDGVSKMYDKAAGQYIAYLVLTEAGMITPMGERKDAYMADTVMLAANSPSLKAMEKLIATPRAFERAVVSLMKQFATSPFITTAYVDGAAVRNAYTYADLLAVVDELRLQDEEATIEAEEKAADKAAKADNRQLTRDISGTIRDVIRTVTIANAMAGAVATMQKNRVPQSTIDSVIAQITAATTTTKQEGETK